MVIAELQVPAEYLHLLEGPVLIAFRFLLTDRVSHGVKFCLYSRKLAFSGQPDQFKAGVRHNDGIIITGSNPPGKAAAVLPFKVLFLRH